jgi:uncharacterized protein (DUF849 family)
LILVRATNELPKPKENTGAMEEPISLREAARREMSGEYPFVAGFEIQPKWNIPEKIAINVAVSGRASTQEEDGEAYPASVEDYLVAAGEVIEEGACGIHVDFSFIKDKKGRRLDRDVSQIEAYKTVLGPLRERFGWGFVANVNVLNGDTFEDCMSPARAGLCEVAPCAAGHPDAFMVPAFRTLEELGVKPEIVVHSSGEIELAKRKLIDTGIIRKPSYWIILYGLPFNSGRTLISGTWVTNTQDMAQHLFMMVGQIRQVDPTAVMTVCAAGRSGLYMTTLATMMGLNIRVGTEDTTWKYPQSNERFESNLQMYRMARDMAGLLGRKPATADEYRAMIGLPLRGNDKI